MPESGSPTGPRAAPEVPAMMTTKDKDGLPQLPAGRKGALMFGMNGYTRRTARIQTTAEIAQFLESVLHVRVAANAPDRPTTATLRLCSRSPSKHWG